jgi:hypothetical protein
MKRTYRPLKDLAYYLGGLLILSVSWVSMHSRNHPGDTVVQAIDHSKVWLLGLGLILGIVVAIFRPSADR